MQAALTPGSVNRGALNAIKYPTSPSQMNYATGGGAPSMSMQAPGVTGSMPSNYGPQSMTAQAPTGAVGVMGRPSLSAVSPSSGGSSGYSLPGAPMSPSTGASTPSYGMPTSGAGGSNSFPGSRMPTTGSGTSSGGSYPSTGMPSSGGSNGNQFPGGPTTGGSGSTPGSSYPSTGGTNSGGSNGYVFPGYRTPTSPGTQPGQTPPAQPGGTTGTQQGTTPSTGYGFDGQRTGSAAGYASGGSSQGNQSTYNPNQPYSPAQMQQMQSGSSASSQFYQQPSAPSGASTQNAQQPTSQVSSQPQPNTQQGQQSQYAWQSMQPLGPNNGLPNANRYQGGDNAVPETRNGVTKTKGEWRYEEDVFSFNRAWENSDAAGRQKLLGGPSTSDAFKTVGNIGNDTVTNNWQKKQFANYQPGQTTGNARDQFTQGNPIAPAPAGSGSKIGSPSNPESGSGGVMEPWNQSGGMSTTGPQDMGQVGKGQNRLIYDQNGTLTQGTDPQGRYMLNGLPMVTGQPTPEDVQKGYYQINPNTGQTTRVPGTNNIGQDKNVTIDDQLNKSWYDNAFRFINNPTNPTPATSTGSTGQKQINPAPAKPGIPSNEMTTQGPQDMGQTNQFPSGNFYGMDVGWNDVDSTTKVAGNLGATGEYVQPAPQGNFPGQPYPGAAGSITNPDGSGTAWNYGSPQNSDTMNYQAYLSWLQSQGIAGSGSNGNSGSSGSSGSGGSGGSGSGSSSPQTGLLIPDLYQQAYDEARKANEDRYNQINAGYAANYQDAMDWQGRSANNLINQYDERYNRNMDTAAGLGAQELKDIQDRFTGERGSAEANMIDRGIGNTTIRPSVLGGVARNESDALGGALDRINRLKLQTDMALSGDSLANQQSLHGERLGLMTEMPQRQLDFMERRTDSYPDLNQLLALGQMYGQAQGQNAGTGGMVAPNYVGTGQYQVPSMGGGGGGYPSGGSSGGGSSGGGSGSGSPPFSYTGPAGSSTGSYPGYPTSGGGVSPGAQQGSTGPKKLQDGSYEYDPEMKRQADDGSWEYYNPDTGKWEKTPPGVSDGLPPAGVTGPVYVGGPDSLWGGNYANQPIMVPDNPNPTNRPIMVPNPATSMQGPMSMPGFAAGAKGYGDIYDMGYGAR